MHEKIKELTAQKNKQETDSKKVLKWAQRVEVQRVQKKVLDDMNSMKHCDHIQMNKQTKIADKQPLKEQKKEHRVENCRYCAAAHM